MKIKKLLVLGLVGLALLTGCEKTPVMKEYNINGKRIVFTRCGTDFDGEGDVGSYIELNLNPQDSSYIIKRTDNGYFDFDYQIKKDGFEFNGKGRYGYRCIPKLRYPNGEIDKRTELISDIVNKEVAAAKDSISKYIRLIKEEEQRESGIPIVKDSSESTHKKFLKGD